MAGAYRRQRCAPIITSREGVVFVRILPGLRVVWDATCESDRQEEQPEGGAKARHRCSMAGSIPVMWPRPPPSQPPLPRVPDPFSSGYAGRMPSRPSFLLDLRFTDLDAWWLRVECCGRTVDMPFHLLAAQRPRATLGGLLAALRCRECQRRPGRVMLLDDPADRIAARIGARGGWRVEIVLPDQGPAAGGV